MLRTDMRKVTDLFTPAKTAKICKSIRKLWLESVEKYKKGGYKIRRKKMECITEPITGRKDFPLKYKIRPLKLTHH